MARPDSKRIKDKDKRKEHKRERDLRKNRHNQWS